jgi:hypothetical protein
MQLLRHFFLVSLFIFLQSCSSIPSMNVDTVAPSPWDGGWLKNECTCSGKSSVDPGIQEANVLIINGNRILQSQMARWKKTEWNHYCTTYAESLISNVNKDSFDVTTYAESNFIPAPVNCNIPVRKAKRTWKIHKINTSELKYESTAGCDSGPLVCSYRRIEK